MTMRSWRLAVGSLLILLAAVGATARGRVRLQVPARTALAGTPAENLITILALPVAALGFVILALILRAMLARKRQRGEEGERTVQSAISRWIRWLSVVFALAALAIPAALVGVFGHRRAAAPPHLPIAPEAPPGHGISSGTSGAGTGAPYLWALLAIVLVVATVAGVVTLRRRMGRSVGTSAAAGGSSREAAAAAVLAGERALRELDEPRAAVIAAYAAMEQRLSSMPFGRRPSDTPGELLRRLAQAGIAPASARSLTELFREARFSTHPVTSLHRESAEQALRDIVSSLAEEIRR